MNQFHLSASELMIWGLVLHLIVDWPLQNDWMAANKTNLRHPAGYVHAGIHGCFLAVIFGWVAIPIAISHLLIDTRKPVVWWSRLVGQSQPKPPMWTRSGGIDPSWDASVFAQEVYMVTDAGQGAPLMDVGMEVRFWTDQVFHIMMIAIAALLVSL